MEKSSYISDTTDPAGCALMMMTTTTRKSAALIDQQYQLISRDVHEAFLVEIEARPRS